MHPHMCMQIPNKFATPPFGSYSYDPSLHAPAVTLKHTHTQVAPQRQNSSYPSSVVRLKLPAPRAAACCYLCKYGMAVSLSNLKTNDSTYMNVCVCVCLCRGGLSAYGDGVCAFSA